MEVTGYHGTSSNIAAIICKEHFKPSKHGWLGVGIYLFEENKALAIQYCKNSRKNNDFQVISCKISVDNGRILDVTSPNSSGTAEFHARRAHFIKAVGEYRIKVLVRDKKHIDEIIYDDLCRAKKYQVVRANTYTYTEEDKLYQISSRVPNGTELCVRIPSLISDVRIASNE